MQIEFPRILQSRCWCSKPVQQTMARPMSTFPFLWVLESAHSTTGTCQQSLRPILTARLERSLKDMPSVVLPLLTVCSGTVAAKATTMTGRLLVTLVGLGTICFPILCAYVPIVLVRESLLISIFQSETYTPPASQQVDQQYYIEPDMAIHGLTGPVNVSYPNWQYNETIPLYQALSALGVPTAEDVNDGTAGITYLPLDLDPVSQTRSTARRAYYDTAASRPNLYVSTGQVVTRVLFENQQENGARTGATPSTRPRLSGGGAQATNSSCNGPDLRAIGVEVRAKVSIFKLPYACASSYPSIKRTDMLQVCR